MRGAKPKPLELKVVDGNPGRRPLPGPDPSVNPLGYAPRGFTKEQRRAWNQVRRECSWLREADRMLVESFCRAWEQMVVVGPELTAAVLAEADPRRITALQRVVDRARDACLRMMAEMGATATSRARVRKQGEKPGKDPAERYFV